MGNTITRACTGTLLDLIASGQQVFDVQVGTAEVVEGDLLQFEDVAGRQLVRRVDAVVRGKDLLTDTETVSDLTIIGLSQGAISPLHKIFGNNGIVVSFALERHGEQVDVAEAPQYTPALVCPPVDLDLVLEQLQVTKWPDGVFSILLAAQVPLQPEAGRLTVEVNEILVLALAHHEQSDVFIEVDQRLLTVGRLQDLYGNDLEPYFGMEEVEDATGSNDSFSPETLLGSLQESNNHGGVE